MWLDLFIIFLVLGLAVLVVFRIKDRRYLKKKTGQALGSDLKKEIEDERNEFARHKLLFQTALNKAKNKNPHGPQTADRNSRPS